MQLPFRILRWLATRPAAIAMLVVVAGRTWGSWRQRSRTRTQRRQAPLPSLYDRIPGASTVPRRRVGVRTVPLDRIVGTLRHPSQNTADFLPLPGLRGRNWESRWQRIQRAIDRLEMLPPIDLVQVGDDYYVEDGHNRVAAALLAGAVEIDADVTQLLLPDQRPSERGWIDASSVVGGEALRQAGRGRHSRTVEQRSASDEMSRSDLIRGEEGPP
jgi:hypothetical protein